MHRIALNRMGLLCAALAFSSVAVSCGRVDKKPGDEAGDVGTVQLALTTPDGQTISSVNYTVTNAAGAGRRERRAQRREPLRDRVRRDQPPSGRRLLDHDDGDDVGRIELYRFGHILRGRRPDRAGRSDPDLRRRRRRRRQQWSRRHRCHRRLGRRELPGHLDGHGRTSAGRRRRLRSRSRRPRRRWTSRSRGASTSGIIAAPTAASTTLQCTAVGMAQVTLTVSRGDDLLGQRDLLGKLRPEPVQRSRPQLPRGGPGHRPAQRVPQPRACGRRRPVRSQARRMRGGLRRGAVPAAGLDLP